MLKAKYTVVLKSLLDDEKTAAEIQKALSNYPMYVYNGDNEEIKAIIPTRDILNKRLLNNYKYYEIGCETPGEFIDKLEIVMDEIMPFYNRMYETVKIMGELPSPFDNVDVLEETTEVLKGSASGSGTSKSTVKANTENTSVNTDSTKTVESETPQGQLNITAENIDNIPYADKVNWNKNHNNINQNYNGESETDNESQNETESNSERKLSYHKIGNQGVNTYAHDMIEFRKTIIDVTNQIINDIRVKELFMLIH